MKRVFVVNPRAGGGAVGRWLGELETYFRRHAGSFEAELCQSREETSHRTRAALERGCEQVIAVGGDGTMNAVLQGFFRDGRPVRSEAALAVSRVGTGSDYFRTVSGGRRVDWREIVLRPMIRPVDVAVARKLDQPDTPPLYFLNMAGYGLSARVVAGKERLPAWLPRSLCYLIPTLRCFLDAQTYHARLEIDGVPHERELLSLIIGKGSYAGGGMRFGGHVSLDDGLLEMTLFHPLKLWQMVAKTPRLYSGNFAGETSIEKFQLRHLRVRTEPHFPGECDGDLAGAGDVEIAVEPRAIRVCFPSP